MASSLSFFFRARRSLAEHLLMSPSLTREVMSRLMGVTEMRCSLRRTLFRAATNGSRADLAVVSVIDAISNCRGEGAESDPRQQGAAGQT